MFSVSQKRSIAEAVQRILRETGHPELPDGEINFKLHVDGAESWSWADIRNNGAVKSPGINLHNEAVAEEMNRRAQPEVAQGWQPIETAPKDGTRVIMGFTKDENGYTMPSCEGFFNRKLVIPEWVWRAAPHSPLCPQPTHFMDMPEPPKETV